MRLFSFVGSLLLIASSHVFAASPQNPVLSEYLRIQDALAADSLEAVNAAAAAIAKDAGTKGPSDKKLGSQMEKAAKELAQAKSIKEARASFKKLSAPTVRWVKESKPAEVEVVHCPMAKADWAQKKGSFRNPYYGKEMLECGDK